MIFDVIVAVMILQILAVVFLKVAIMFRRPKGKAEIPETEVIVPQSGTRYDWTEEKAILRDKTRRQQGKILAPWVVAVVREMGCSKYEAEKFFQINLAGVLK
jgi:hypothetical protein